MNRQALWLHLVLLTTLLIPSVLPAAGPSDVRARARFNSEDIQESRKAAEQFLQYLKDEDFSGAYELGASRFKSLITRQNLQMDIEGRQQGGTVKDWRLKAYRTKEGAPRYMFLLYHVEGSKTTGDWEFTMELTQNPYQWRVWSIKGIEDSQTEQNARAARVTAEQFLRCLKQHAYQIADRLFSPRGKAAEGRTLKKRWEETEKRKGTLTDWTLQSYHATPAARNGDRQDHVVLVYRARHSRAEDEAVLTMVRIGTQWWVEAVEFIDAVDSGNGLPAGAP